jgi:ribosomal protein S11
MTVSYNYVHDLSPDPVYGSYSILLRNVKDVTVSNNLITDTVTGLSGQQFRRGIALRGIQEAEITNNTVNFGSTASAQATYAISMQQKLDDGGNGDDLPISDVVISGNTVSGVIWGINISELDSQANGIVVKENTVRKVFTGVHFRSWGQAGTPVVQELLVEKNDFSTIQNSGALVSSGILSAGVQIFSLDTSAPAVNEFDGVQVRANSLPTGNVNQLGQINGLNVGAIQNPADFSFWPTVINNLDASGNYWGSASAPVTSSSRVSATPYIASYKIDPAKAGEPGFWPVILYSAQAITFAPVRSLSATASTYTLSATSTSGLTVTFTEDSAACSISGTTLTVMATGTCVVTASQAGDSTYAAASIRRSIVITAAAQPITGFSPASSMTLAATGPQPTQSLSASAGAEGTAEVTFETSSAACEVVGITLTAKAAGTCVVTASRDANAKFAATSVTRTIQIRKAAQAISFTPVTARRISQGDYELVATASSDLTVSYAATGSCSVTPGTTTLTFSGAAGPCVITATQAGNANYVAAKTVFRTIWVR